MGRSGKRIELINRLVSADNVLYEITEAMSDEQFNAIYNHLKIIEKLKREENMTILFTTHNLFFVENWANKMLVLDNGESIFEGEPNEGLNNTQVLELLGSYDKIRELIKND